MSAKSPSRTSPAAAGEKDASPSSSCGYLPWKIGSRYTPFCRASSTAAWAAASGVTGRSTARLRVMPTCAAEPPRAARSADTAFPCASSR